MIKVSVIMGIYNCERTLKYSIQSIINQTYNDWELIMCDDCSTDNTYEIAKTYTESHKNITLLKNKKNMGLAYTLNKCLGIAQGDYIARADGDDICLPERFKKQVDFLNENLEYNVVGSSIILYDETGDKAIRRTIEYPEKYDLLYRTPFVHPTIMMRKKTYDALEGYTISERTKRGQDTDLWFRFFAFNYKGYNIQEPLLKYHEGLNDYGKRGFRVRWMGVKTRFIGYRLLKFPIIYYIFLIKPLIAALVPRKVMYLYHKSIKGQKI